MKIISLRFANLNSLPGPYLIRFDVAPLADTGLFAITGPTGAGKSTLLDAIAVGLYGRVPRHDRQVGEMVSRHAQEAWSEVEFEVHETHPDTGHSARVRYRSRWQVTRKRRGEDKGSLNQDAMSLVRCLPGDGEPSEAVESGKEKVPAKVGELSGLDFNQFEQAVLLSQGKFARFLHARESERGALLEKMTNVGIYSQLGAAAYEKAKAEEQQTSLLEASLHATRLLPPDERQRLEQLLDELNQETEYLFEHQQQLSEFLAWRTEHDLTEQALADATRAAERLQQAGAALQPDLLRLARHEQAAAPTLARALALHEQAHGEHQRDADALAQLETQLPTLLHHTEAAAAAAAEATTQAATAQAEADERTPLLQAMQEQDAALAASRHELGRRRAALAAEQAAHEAQEAAWHHQTTGLGEWQQRAADLQQWLLAHQHERTLREELETINRELNDLAEANTTLATLAARQQAQLTQLAEAAAERQRHEQAAATALAEQESLLMQSRPHRDEYARLLPGHDATPDQQHAALTQRLTQLRQLLPLAQATHDHATQAQALAAEYATQAPTLAQVETAFAGLTQELADAGRVLASLQLTLRAQQAKADLNTHRQHLQAGQPCPLCGALEHLLGADFVADADAYERQATAQQATLAQLQPSHAEAGQELARLRYAQQQRHARQHEAAAAAEVARTQAAALAAPLAVVATPAAVAAALAEAARQQEAAEATQRRLAELTTQLATLDAKHAAAATRHQQALAETHRADTRHQQAQLALQPLDAALADARQQATNYRQVIADLLRPHQLALPAAPPYAGVLATLGERADDYATQVSTLADTQHQLTRLHQQQATEAAALAATATRLATEAAALAADEHTLAQHQAARLARYPHPDPAADAERLRRAARQLALAAQQAEADHARQQLALVHARTQLAERQTGLARQRVALDARRTELAAALQATGFATAADALAQLLPDADARRLTQQRQQHHTALSAAGQLQAQLTHTLLRHQELALTAQSAPTLKAELKQLQQEAERLHQRYGATAGQLALDDEARQQQAQGLRQLEARQREQQRWQALAEQIGSARGDKFSRFAQGLTLSHLARLANHRLQQLTHRYTILKTPGQDLELQIVDHDQADTVRPMASLSGGESFLVSLALALGLSELAGYKARIESLFIDEGFGTLDPDALNTALDALERLQHTGKMIGVISHVADLKERIGTQIRVQPVAGGNSTVHLVDVVGNEVECRG